MADKHSKEMRSYNMSRIRSRNTTPEEIVRRHLFSQGFRFLKNDKRYAGRPDVVLPKYKTMIFVNGCFWHCHDGCKEFVIPKSNTDYWIPKLENNRKRDIENVQLLRQNGWNVIVVWECELKNKTRDERLIRLCEQIKTGREA